MVGKAAINTLELGVAISKLITVGRLCSGYFF